MARRRSCRPAREPGGDRIDIGDGEGHVPVRRVAVLERQDPGDALAEARAGRRSRRGAAECPGRTARGSRRSRAAAPSSRNRRPSRPRRPASRRPRRRTGKRPRGRAVFSSLKFQVPGAFTDAAPFSEPGSQRRKPSTGWIDAGHLSSQIADGGWLGDHRPAGVADPDDCGISVVDPDGGVPRRRIRGTWPSRADRRDVAAVNGRDRVRAGSTRRRSVVDRAIRRGRRRSGLTRRVGRFEIDPGRYAGWESLALAHRLLQGMGGVGCTDSCTRRARVAHRVRSPHGRVADGRRCRGSRRRGRRLLLHPRRCRPAGRLPSRLRARGGPRAGVRRRVGAGPRPDRRARRRARRPLPGGRRGPQPRDHGRAGTIGPAGGGQLERLPPGR